MYGIKYDPKKRLVVNNEAYYKIEYFFITSDKLESNQVEITRAQYIEWIKTDFSFYYVNSTHKTVIDAIENNTEKDDFAKLTRKNQIIHSLNDINARIETLDLLQEDTATLKDEQKNLILEYQSI